ncbi:asparagine synthase (glutamine-hydrolyzing) [Paucilactobacillus suebicus]|uniref:asparagine synthase (glutamine-hydrolyzing) n=1 Tax=Paucilactobacillus suebicus DSM 5007 = KCTC 3549 TaxID=1423807 RepID=A0A0R1W3Z1_9LACO|nr:asparagine synthase (glutamine-hydrolyzing) [Paucilactobacillus suebicus]KRM12317.1 asparagine synthase [Paucilactobacillus suebicus DSM 5007 = KCTC 3549]
MCGFVGVIGNGDRQSRLQDVKSMNSIITHRGPDDEGYFENEWITAGFRRLSIVDLVHGAQPMSLENQRYWIVFNGEIYNHVELRNQLVNEGETFTTDSDTEVILAMYKKYGVKCVNYLRGMFAFVIWDTESSEIFGARDHFGIKPLHYAKQNEHIYFASEKKALQNLLKDERINDQALQDYMTFQYVPDPWTMTPSVEKLRAGHYFVMHPGEKMEIKRYFYPQFKPCRNDSEHKITGEVRDCLIESVQKHMRSDVPVGAFLSGGIDSSIIVALAHQLNPNLHTYSVGFERPGYSEIDVAKETAACLDVDNISETITPLRFAQDFHKFVYSMDDPLADPAAVAQYFLTHMAGQHCKVALSGEGADEIFGGYNIYNEPNSLKVFRSVPNMLNHVLHGLATLIPEGVKGRSFIERGTTPIEMRYVGNAKIFSEAEKKRFLKRYDPTKPYTHITKKLYQNSVNLDPITRMEDIDMNTWLIGDLLLNADRTSMAASLELRTPFIDKEVFRVASSIPTNLKIAHHTTKYVLRKAVEEIVPGHVLHRRKLGFPVPIRYWLQDELYDWAFKIIKESDVDQYINKSYAVRLLQENRQGKKNKVRKLWTLLTFMVWHQIYIEHKYTDLV